MKLMSILLFAILILSSPVLAMRNPAAVYCNALGYTYHIEKTKEGDLGICILDNGKPVDAWKFFLGKEMGEKSYCVKKGYELKIISGEECEKYGVKECAACVVNGTPVEVSKLMNLSFEENIIVKRPPTTSTRTRASTSWASPR